MNRNTTRQALVFLFACAVLGYYTLIRPDAPGGQFVAGLALGLACLVIALSTERARHASADQATRVRIEQIARSARS